MNECFNSCRVSLSVDSLDVSGSSCSVDDQGTKMIYRPSSPILQPAITHSQYSVQESETSPPVISADFTVSHGRTADASLVPRAAQEGEGSTNEFFDHNLKLCLRQMVLFIDKATILKVASLISLLNGSFNTE